MRFVLGCTISQALLERWTSLLVYEYAPFFLPEMEDRLLPRYVPRFTRVEFNQVAPSLEYRDSYTTWAVHQDATCVALLSPNEFHTLPRATQQALLLLQWKFGRSQIYAAESICAFLTPNEWEATQAHARFATPEGDQVALDYALWHTLTPETQWRWLIHFVSEDRSPCLSLTLTPEQWSHLREQHGPSVLHLAGSFAWSSGPNCFSTTLAAATRALGTATTIAALWLPQAPFMRGLTAQGYALDAAVPINAALPAGAVLVWVDAHDALHHACYVLGEGLVLNKDAQAWYAPRQILSLATVVEQWREDNLQVQVYTRRVHAVDEGSNVNAT